MKTLKKMKIIIVGFLVYVLVFGGIIFCIPKNVSIEYKATSDVTRFFGEEEGPDRVALVETPEDSVRARIDIIKEAEETLEIAYYRLSSGAFLDLFVGVLQEAADRGVKVRIILDGLSNGLTGKEKSKIYMMEMHPNIEIKFYEKPNVLMPWTINNRLHEKYIISDSKYVLLGGRNIGDHYISPTSYNGVITNDRDVLVINESDSRESCVYEVKERFEEIWDSQYSYNPTGKMTNLKQKKGIEESNRLREYIEEINLVANYTAKDWLQQSHPTNKVTLLTTPIERFNKEPWIWYELSNLIKSTEGRVILQSPYIIPTANMKETFEYLEENKRIVEVVTNSMASTPNYPAFSGYMRHRRSLVDYGFLLYEYQGPDSIHAKTIVIDDRFSIVGSFNLEARSMYLSTEVMLVIDSEPFTKELNNAIDHHKENSLRVGEEYKYIEEGRLAAAEVPILKRIALYASSMITMFFDYLL